MKAQAHIAAAAGAIFLFGASTAMADIKVGITISATGPAAAIGVPAKNSVPLLPPEIAGHKVQYVVLDDASDGTKAVANARKLITEEKIDVLLGSSIAPTTFPLVDIAAETGTVLIATTPTSRIVEPMDEKRRWVFKVVPHDTVMARAMVAHMVKAGVKTVGFIGFNDAFGDTWYASAEKVFAEHGIRIVAKEAFARTDTSVSGQALKLVAAKPDAIFVAASGTPAVLPQKALKERGYNRQIYHSNGVATMDFVRVGGKDVEGVVLPTGPITVAADLADDNASKKLALDYIRRYEDLNKVPYAAFGPHVVDSMNLLARATPAALTRANPGTPEFRAALRDAIEQLREVPLINGVLSMSASDHCGYDQRAAVMVKLENGTFKLIK